VIKIDRDLLERVGLNTLHADLANLALRCVYDVLEARVGIRLADAMTNEQLDEFETYFQRKDDAGAFAWLERNFPNYKEIVQDEFQKLQAEIEQDASEILDGVDELTREFGSPAGGGSG
jgi:Protein of unknown function (DUF5663)